MGKPIIGIIGVGFVGTAVYHTFSPYFKIKLFDKYKLGFDSLEEVVNNSDYLFVCVPTPVDNKGQQDLSNINDTIEAIDSISKKQCTIIIRSTIIPGTTRKLAEKYKKHIFIFCPEFLTERTAVLDSINAYRIILGSDSDKVWNIADDVFEVRYPHVKIFITSLEAAELVKYVTNCFFSVKIAYMNEVYEICNKMNISYDLVKAMFLSDQRTSNSHTDVPGPDGYKGFGGKCLYKDLHSLKNFAKQELNLDMNMLEAANEVNERVREKKDWLEIKGATSDNNYC